MSKNTLNHSSTPESSRANVDSTAFVEKLRAADISPLQFDKLRSTQEVDRFLNQVRAVARKHPGSLNAGIDDVTWSWEGDHEVTVLRDLHIGIPRNWAEFQEIPTNTHFDRIVEFSGKSTLERQISYAAQVLAPILNREQVLAIKTSKKTDGTVFTEEEKLEKLKALVDPIWVTDSKTCLSPAHRLRQTVEGIRIAFQDFVEDNWLRDLILEGGRYRNFAALRKFIVKNKNLSEKLECHSRVSDLVEDIQKVIKDSKSTYGAKYHRLQQLARKFTVRPIKDDKHELFFGAYDNEERPDASDRAEKPPMEEGLPGTISNEKETIGVSQKIFCMALALTHIPRKEIVTIENRFVKDHGSLHPLAISQYKYEFQEAIMLAEKAGNIVPETEKGQEDLAKTINRITVSPSMHAEALERLHVAGLQKWRNKDFDTSKAPKWTRHFSKQESARSTTESENAHQNKSIQSFNGKDICSYCAHFRQDLALHLRGVGHCPYWDQDNNRPKLVPKHLKRNNEHVQRVAARYEQDLQTTIDYQY